MKLTEESEDEPKDLEREGKHSETGSRQVDIRGPPKMGGG